MTSELPDAGPPRQDGRGTETRHALIAAGLELFGEHGPAATSTRMLAAHAGANVASIAYYFGSKEGLYLAVVEHIVERVQAQLAETIRPVRRLIDRRSPSRHEAREALVSVMHAMASLFVESDESRAWARIIVREQSSPTAAFDVLYEGQIQPMQFLIAELVAAATGLHAGNSEVKLRSHALVGQVLGFLVARESLLRHLGTRRLDRGHTESIRAILGAHVRACLDSAAAEP